MEVYTGPQGGADTKVKGYAQLFGKRGDTGRRKLLRHKEDASKDDMFLPGKVTVYCCTIMRFIYVSLSVFVIIMKNDECMFKRKQHYELSEK